MRLVAALARHGGEAATAGIWPTAPPEQFAERARQIKEAPDGTVDVEAVAAAFKAEIEDKIAIDDASSHLYLAIAYSEMGMHADAVREAAISLSESADGPDSNEAFVMLVTQPLLLPNGLAALRAQLRWRGTLH